MLRCVICVLGTRTSGVGSKTLGCKVALSACIALDKHTNPIEFD